MLTFWAGVPCGFSEEAVQPTVKSHESLIRMQGEVLEVAELTEPKGAAIYTVKDFESGETVKFFAHPYRSTVQIGNAVKSAADVLGGSKVSIIYQRSGNGDMPEVVFLKAASSYYS